MDYYFTELDHLQVNWINDGTGAKDIYPVGESVDASRGEQRRCIWTWKTTQGIRPGLVYLRCHRCGANAHAVIASAGSLTLPCNADTYVGTPMRET